MPVTLCCVIPKHISRCRVVDCFPLEEDKMKYHDKARDAGGEPTLMRTKPIRNRELLREEENGVCRNRVGWINFRYFFRGRTEGD